MMRQEKAAFLARMSHEIRTPLSAVIGFSRLLDATRDSLSAKEAIRIINQTVQQLLYVIDDILSFSRLEAGNMVLEAIPLDLWTCLEDVVVMMSPAAHEKGLELVLHLHGVADRFKAGVATLPDRPSQQPFEGCRALSVEDNEFNRTLLRYLLTEKGAEVVEAASGEEAIGMAKARRYDLIFMDLHMPGIDGAEAARQIRRHYAHEVPPILALSADVFAERQSELGGNSFDEYLIKPISAETLDRIAAKWLGSKRNEAVSSAGLVSNRAGTGRLEQLPGELMTQLYAEILRLRGVMQSALAESAWQALREHAHQLYGLVALYGLRELMASAQSVEQAVNTQGFDAVKHHVDQLTLLIDELPPPTSNT
jgi:CheY-like chemotaxis protein